MTESLATGRPVYDAAVVGGGVVGVACALELARRGRRVAVVERDRIGSGCSHGNAGWLTPSLALPLPAPGVVRKALAWMLDRDGPFYVRPRADLELASWLLRFWGATGRRRFERGTAALVELATWSCAAWRELAARGAEFGYSPVGMVQVFERSASLAGALATIELVARSGVRFERWSADELAAREPGITGAQVGGYFFPDDAHCEPDRAVAALAEEARRAGVDLLEGVEVYGVAREGDAVRALETTRGALAARDVVLATGAWSKSFGRRLGLRLPVLGAKGYTVIVPRLERQPTRSLMLAERKVAIVPHERTLRLSGTLELVDEDLSITRRRVETIVRAVRAMLPLPEPLEVVELWRGLRPCTPDGLPLIGRAGGWRNLWLATGHQMTGLKTSPGTGRLLAELMHGETPSFDPAPFRADRY
jgi:D-amino-acid dehydrogenase